MFDDSLEEHAECSAAENQHDRRRNRKDEDEATQEAAIQAMTNK